MKRVVMIGLMLAALAASPALADPPTRADLAAEMEARLNAPPDPTSPPVESLTCEQMYAEMSVAGQQMQAQLDPNFATNVQSMSDDMQARQRGAMAGAMASGLTCAVPILGMACGAVMNAQMAGQQRQAAQDQQRMDAIMGQVTESTAGLDLARMQAMNERWESQHCQMPEGAMPAAQ